MVQKTMMDRVRTNSKPQLNKDNKGASLVSVLTIVSIVTMLITVILAVVIMNVYMKKADRIGQQTFYDAESTMEEIRLGLGTEVSAAASTAYIDVLTNYSKTIDEEIAQSKGSSKVDLKTKKFKEEYSSELIKNLRANYQGLITGGSDADGYSYDPRVLKVFLVDTAMKDNVGGEILFDEDVYKSGGYHINIETDDGIVFKNVSVRYTDKDGYVSTVKADVCLEYPDINFQNLSSMDNILTYSIIANSDFATDNGDQAAYLTGNAFLGGGTDTKDTKATIKRDLNLIAPSGQDTNVICGTDFNITSGNTVTVAYNNKAAGYNSDIMSFWANSIKATGNFVVTNGNLASADEFSSTFLQNDLRVNGGTVDLQGRLIMFGNPWKIQALNSDGKESCAIFAQGNGYKDLIKKNMANYSSTIIIDGKASTLDLSKLDTMVIGGSAYVNTSIENSKVAGHDDIISDSDKVSSDVVTGQSIALKSDQRAYLVPASVVGIGYEHGGTNPMTADEFNALLKEIADDTDKNYGGDTRKVQQSDVVNFNLPVPEYGVPLSMFGVNNYKVRAYVRGKSSVIYLFMQFETIGTEEDARNGKPYYPAETLANQWYYSVYLNNKSKKAVMDDNLEYYASKIALPTKLTDPKTGKINTANMYFTGDIVSFVGGTSKVDLAVINQSDIFNQETNDKYSEQCIQYQNSYFYLRKALTTISSNILSDSLNIKSSLFETLVNEDAMKTQCKATGNVDNKDEYFVSTSGNAAYINYDASRTGDKAIKLSDITKTKNSTSGKTLISEAWDKNGSAHSDAELNLIVVSGDLIIDEDFEGCLIVKGNVTVTGPRKITANAKKAAAALQASKHEKPNDLDSDEYNVRECIRNAEYFLVGGYADPDGNKEGFTMSDLISYRNWTRQ